MLSAPCFHEQPFPYFAVSQTFSQEQCKAFDTLFSLEGEWQHRDGSFYQCSILDVTNSISSSVQQDIISRVRDITNMPLVDRILITAQKMQPGQAIGIHSDRPLLGYEILRLVVQFNKNWQADHGGVLELFASEKGEAIARVNPEYNKGFVFVLNENSYHSVTKALQPRQSLVFNFWHMANTPELEEHIRDFFTNIHFSELPEALDPIAAAAEFDLSEDVTFVAETAAVALKRWGYDDPTILKGYQYSAGLANGDESDEEVYTALRLANWVAGLYRESFNLDNWQVLRDDLAGKKIAERLEKTWRLCLPVLD